jgi:hypothetical protein
MMVKTTMTMVMKTTMMTMMKMTTMMLIVTKNNKYDNYVDSDVLPV